MPSIDPGVVNPVARVLLLPAVWRWIQRGWYRLCSRCALRKFRSLAPLVEGLLEQRDRDGAVNRGALRQLAAQLDALSVYPRAIRGERSTDFLGEELQALRQYTNSREDYLSLPLARESFSTGPLRDPDTTRDTLRAAYKHLFEKKK